MEEHQTKAELPPAEVKEEMIDYQFVEVDSHYMHQLCTACLCATRTPHMLDDNTLKQYYMNILTETQTEEDLKVLLPPRLCWETLLHLKRLVCFREQVQDSYRLLQQKLLTCDKEYLDELLQSSVCRPGRLQTCFAHSVDIAPRDEELPVMTADHGDADVGVEQLLMQVKEEGDLETEAASECQETYIERRSTLRETVATIIDCVKEDLNEMDNYRGVGINDELLEETNERMREPVTQYVKTSNTAGFQCAFKSHLIKHRTYTDKKPFQTCSVCRKSFTHKTSLKNHLRTRTGDKPFQCSVCRKSFSHKTSLNNHLRTHTDDKPFQCSVCRKSFSQRTSLINHLRTHTGDKLFQCEVCSKSFATKCSLKEHFRRHTAEKPFHCEVCLKSFVQQGSLTRHRRTHTGEKPVSE